MPYFQFCFVVHAHFLFISVYWCGPKGYVVGVLLFYLTSSHSEKQLGFASINGVVVNIRPVNESVHARQLVLPGCRIVASSLVSSYAHNHSRDSGNQHRVAR